jgi:hypothetical protein
VHKCNLRAPGHADVVAEVSMKEGETRSVELKLGANLAELGGVQQPAEVAAGGGPEAAGRGAIDRRTVGLVVGGTGIAVLGVGGVVGIVAKKTYDNALGSDCRGGVPSACNSSGVSGGQSAHTLATVATAAFVTGGVLLAGGAAIYFTAPKGSHVGVAPSVGPTGAGVLLRGVW